MTFNVDTLHREAERRLDDALTWCRLGAALLEQAQLGGVASDRVAGIAACRHAATIAKTAPEIAAVAAALAEGGELDDACAHLLRLEVADGEALARHVETVVRLLLDAGRHGDALALLRRTGARAERDEGLRLLRAAALTADGALERALGDVDAVLAIRPTLVGAHLLRARVLDKLGRATECVAAWQHAARVLPDSEQVRTGLGMALAASGRHDEAVEILSQIVEHDPTSAEGFLNLSLVLREANQLDEAEWAARRAIELKPSVGEPYYDLGLVLEKGQRWEEAAGAFREAIQRQGGGARPFAALARVLEQLGRIEDAIDMLTKASALDPNREPERTAEALARLRARAADKDRSFAGGLAAFSLRQILELLHNLRSTGRLELVLKSSKVGVFLRGGRLVRLVSDRVPPLAGVVRTLGGIDEARLASALRGCEGESDIRVGRQLVRFGVLAPPVLMKAFDLQLQMTLEQLIDLQEGTFNFHHEKVESRETDADLDIQLVLLEITRMRDARAASA